MIPLGDDNSQLKRVPVVTYGLIAFNILFFLLEVTFGEEFIVKWAFIPARFLEHPVAEIPTLFSAMFMHAGFAHIAGNMLYLWIFGDNVEDRLGPVKFLLFYLVCGLAATFAQMGIDPASSIPNLGASGAIAGVLGAYIRLFPQGQVRVMVGRTMTQLSALAVIGFWFLLQFMSTMGSLASAGEGGGVAYMAHVGGFVAGLAMAFFLKRPPPTIS